METEKVEINGRIFQITELLAVEFDDIMELVSQKDKTKALVTKSTKLSDEDYNKLTQKERFAIMKTINKLNGWSDEDFQTPSQQEEKKE